MTLVLIYFTLAISLSFLCSVLEAVLLSTPISYINLKETEGANGAKLLRNLKTDIDKPISAILSLNTIAHTIGAAGVGAEAVKVFGEEYFGVISAILTVLILVLSEIIPKTIGACYWKQLCIVAAKIIRVMIFITYPLVWISEWITRLFSSKDEKTISREEVSAMVNVGEEEGVFQKEESNMLRSLIKMQSVTAKDIMTPRVVAETASEELTVKAFYSQNQYKSFSRIPVYADNKDFITGYILKQTVLECLAEDKFDVRLKDIKREILMFDEKRKIKDIWEKMMKKKEQISIVINEYGGFQGILTMEDIIESVLGLEIMDEKDMVADMQKLAKERWQKKRKDNPSIEEE